MDHPIHISGAGPASLAAVLTVAGEGGKTMVSELHADAGHRFQEALW